MKDRILAQLRAIWKMMCTPPRTVLSGESFFMRLLFAIVVWNSLVGYVVRYETIPTPVGIARWTWLWTSLGWDLTRLSDPVFWGQCLTLAKVALFFYVAGVGVPLAIPVMAVIHIAIRTLNNSQGAPHHGHQMVSLILLAQWITSWVCGAMQLYSWAGRKQQKLREEWLKKAGGQPESMSESK